MKLALVLLLCAVPAMAQTNDVRDIGAPWPTFIDMSRSTAMGGAHSAIASSNDAILVNPAGLSQGRRYHLEVDGVLDPSFPAQAVTASIVDTISSPVGTGMVFSRWGSGQPEGRGEGWLLGFSYSTPIGGSLFAGGTTKYLRFHTPDGLLTKWAEDLGILSRKGNFSWALVMQNISTEKLPLFPLTGTFGLAWGSDADWHISFDYKSDLSDLDHIKHRFAGGGELLLDQSIALRAGGNWETAEHRFWVSAGAALLTEKGALQVAWRRRVHGSGEDQVFEAGITLYME